MQRAAPPPMGGAALVDGAMVGQPRASRVARSTTGATGPGRRTLVFSDLVMGDLQALADAVSDEPSFRRFLDALSEDWKDERRKEAVAPSSPYGPGANGWENATIGAFLESAAAWAEASASGTPHYAPPDNPWRRCAHILLAGKHYE